MGLWVSLSSHPPHILRSAVYVGGYGDSVFQTHGAWVSLFLHSPHILRSAVYVRGYGVSVFQTHGGMGALSSHPSPRTSSAPLRMCGVTEIASSRRMGAWFSLSLHPPHILRSAAYVRGYRDSVFQTHRIMVLSILASPAHTPLRMYGVTEMASSRRIGSWGLCPRIHLPAHTPLCCVCTGLRRWRLPDAWNYGSLYPCIPRTSSAPLRMYGVTEIASSRRMGLLDSISKFFIPHSSFIIFNFNSLCPVKNQYICKNKLNVKR